MGTLIKNVPMIMQMEALECGAASLAMILAYYGKWIPLEEIRRDCGVSRDGSDSRRIMTAAENYGLQADAYRFDLDQVQRLPDYPCILFWDFCHFVVLTGFHKGKAHINDPGMGRVVIPMEEFSKSFTGICLCFKPTERFEQSGSKPSVLAFAKRRLKGTLIPILFVTLTGAITAVINVVNPTLYRIFLDHVLKKNDPYFMTPLLWVMVLALIILIIVSFLNQIYLLKIRGKLAVTSSTQFFWHVLHMPMEFFSQRAIGDIANRQNSNDFVAEILISKLSPFLLNMALILVYLTVMLTYNAALTMVVFLIICINIYLSKKIADKRLNTTRVILRKSAEMDSTMFNGIESIETLKASGAEDGFFEHWSGSYAVVNECNVRNIKINNYLGIIPEFLNTLTTVIILIMGVALIFNGEFTIGMLLAFQSLVLTFLVPINSILDVGQSFLEMRSSMERIDDVMNYATDTSEEQDKLDPRKTYQKLSGAIELKQVSFGYSPLEPPLIQDFNLTLKPGSRIALIGASGSGKSTVSKLISGLYKPRTGEVLFDGKPISEIPRSIITASLAVVDQEIVLFDDTISNNLRMWDKTISMESVVKAARDAGIHETILQRQEGYEYKMLDGGRDFSGGQKQRLEIARALAQDPTIIILDEATSALDTKTEFSVAEAIKARGITCIIVAHRLSTIRDCDEILVLDKGKVTERGTHRELMALGGRYTTLITTE